MYYQKYLKYKYKYFELKNNLTGTGIDSSKLIKGKERTYIDDIILEGYKTNSVYAEIIKKEEGQERVKLNIPYEKTQIEGCDKIPILSDEESLSFDTYGSRKPNQRITIDGNCFFVNEIYKSVFTKNDSDKYPKMISPMTRARVTRSELEKLIVAYFKQNPNGPFLMPGYISFTNMIESARQVARPDIDQNYITKLTAETDKIIMDNRYTAIIENITIANEKKPTEKRFLFLHV